MVDRVRSKPPPGWFVHHVANPLLRRVIPGRMGRLLPGVAVLRFRGHRTDAPYAVPVGIYDHDGAQVAFTEAGWAANFREGRSVGVVRRGRTTMAHGVLVTDPAYVGAAIRDALDAGTSATMLGLAIDPGHRPTDAELAAVRSAVVIRPQAPGGTPPAG
jgi:hypothetical protein